MDLRLGDPGHPRRTWPTWLCRILIRFSQVPGMVVVGPHAGHLSVFGDHLRRRTFDRALCPLLQIAQGCGRHPLREGDGLHALGLHDVHSAAGTVSYTHLTLPTIYS